MLRINPSVRIALLYATVGCAWIVGTDWAVNAVIRDPTAAARAQTYKGWLFVGLSTLLIYGLIRHHLRREEDERRRAARLSAELQEAQRIAGVGHWSMELTSGRLWWSDEIYRTVGVERGDFEPTFDDFLAFVHPDDRDRFEAAHQAAVEEGSPLDVTYRIVRRGGEVRWVRARGEVGRDGEEGEPRLIGTGQDVTEPTVAERKLRRSEARLKALSAHLQQAREDERRRLSRDIHDQVGGTLAGIRMTLGRLRTEAEGGPEIVRELAGRIEEDLEGTIRAVRELSREMHPGILDELGLAPSIEWLAGDFQSRFDGEVELEIRDEGRIELPNDRAIHVFRIAQEALTNVARHAGADRVRIVLAGADDGIHLEIEDDGRGFDTRESGDGMGLVNMWERAMLLGGSLDVGSTPDGGTRVEAWFPVAGRSGTGSGAGP